MQLILILFKITPPNKNTDKLKFNTTGLNYIKINRVKLQVEKLDRWVLDLSNGQEMFENEQRDNMNKIDFWITANHRNDQVNIIFNDI